MEKRRQSAGLLRRTVARLDRAVLRLVATADDGIAGFVGSVERTVARYFRLVRRDERRAVSKAVSAERTALRTAAAAERAVAAPVRRPARAGRGLLAQTVADVAAVCGTVFRIPGRVGRAAEALATYWTTGCWRFLGRIAHWVSTPVRKRIAARAKRQALASVTMTPDHQSHRELLALLVVGAALAVGTVLLLGKDLGLRTPDPSTFAGLADLPGRAWHLALGFSPLKLTLLAAGTVLAVVATVFWFRMLRDSYRRDYPTAVEQTQWRLVTTLLFIPGAVLYFFKQYNRLTFRTFAARHVVSLMVTGVTVLVATSTYGTLWYFNQQAQADVAGTGYRTPTVKLNPNERRRILSRDQYGAPLKPATTGRRDPFAPIPGEHPSPKPSPSPSPSASPAP